MRASFTLGASVRARFWQGRFGAVVMGEEHLGASLGYVSLARARAACPARAGLALASIRDRFPRFTDLLATNQRGFRCSAYEARTRQGAEAP
jgi:hypothetical protein